VWRCGGIFFFIFPLVFDGANGVFVDGRLRDGCDAG